MTADPADPLLAPLQADAGATLADPDTDRAVERVVQV